MILFRKVGAFVLLTLISFITKAEVATNGCATPVLNYEGLQRIGCSILGELVTEKYVGAVPSSVYATSFDQRSVIVVYGTNEHEVKEAAGVPNDSRGIKYWHTRLITPPFEEQIVSKASNNKTKKYHQWKIWSERVQYGAQGGVIGYVIDCSTAIRSNKMNTTAVAECYPTEEWRRYLHTLEAIK